MAKAKRKALARLQRRTATHVATKDGSTHLPGSLSKHKSASVSSGGRPRDKIKADSYKATS